MSWLQLHPKIKAAAAAAIVAIAGSVAGYLRGDLDGSAAAAAVVSALLPLIAGYLKAA